MIPEVFFSHPKKICIVLDEQGQVLMLKVQEGYTVFLLTEDNIRSWENDIIWIENKGQRNGRELWVAFIQAFPLPSGTAFAPVHEIVEGINLISDRKEKEEALLFLLKLL